MNTPFLTVSNLSFAYPQEGGATTAAVKNLSFEIARGEFVTVLGHNGSGKSTLAKLLNGILVPDEGDVLVDSINTRDDERIFDIRKKIGMVFQNPDNQLVSSIVEEDVAFGPENLGLAPEEIRRRVDEALAAVGMSDAARRAPHTLSGGQKQRIAIAGVLAMQPDCIVFDESTAMLDPRGRREILDTIHHLQQTLSMTVILITHHMNEAVESDRTIVMNEGEIVLDATPAEVFSNVELLWKIGLDVPQTAELLHLISSDEKGRALNLKKGLLTAEEVVDTLRGILKGEVQA